MRLKDRSGMAVLFDAMMFLTVMTLVSVSMLSLLRSDQDEDGSQRYVDSVHATILASTISFQEGPPCTVADLVGSYLRTGDERLEENDRGRGAAPFGRLFRAGHPVPMVHGERRGYVHPSEAKCSGMQGEATSTSPRCVGRTTGWPWSAA